MFYTELANVFVQYLRKVTFNLWQKQDSHPGLLQDSEAIVSFSGLRKIRVEMM